MKRILFLLAFGLTFVGSASAQKVYSTDHEYQAEVKVYVVDHEYQADLLVYKESHDYQATGNEGKWFFVDKDYKADVTVYALRRTCPCRVVLPHDERRDLRP